MKATVVGIEKITKVNKESGEAVFNYNLHVLRDEKKGVEGMIGRRVETVWVPFEMSSDVKIGSYCDFDFDIVQTKSGSFTRLDCIDVLGDRRIEVTPVVKNAGR